MLYFTKNESIIVVLLLISLLGGAGLTIYKPANGNKGIPIEKERQFTEFEKCLNERAKKKVNNHDRKVIKQLVLIQINKATQKEFESLPNVGPVLAQRIIDFRIQNGDFTSIDELLKVKGIGKKTLYKIRPYLTL